MCRNTSSPERSRSRDGSAPPCFEVSGRLGRLLIVFFLVVRDRLPEPLLCLSPYFEGHRQQYYDALQGVRERGDLDQWLQLFLDGVRIQAVDAVDRAERLTDLRERYRATVQAATRGIANQVVELAVEQRCSTHVLWSYASASAVRRR